MTTHEHQRIYHQAIAGKCADVFPSDGSEWVSVRLRDVIPPHVSGTVFGGLLSALERDGCYRPDTMRGFGLFLLQKGLAQ